MYNSVTGRKLVSLVNEKEGTNLTVKDFFYQKFYPLFYDYPKYLLWITNSPFVQGLRKDNPPMEQIRKQKLADFTNKITLKSNNPDGSLAVGYSSEKDDDHYSGQITNLKIPVDEEEIYCTWIGAGLGICVNGGMSLLIEQHDLLYLIYEGWWYYRNLIEETPGLKANQIETWNGQWIRFALNNSQYKSHVFRPVESSEEGLKIQTISWIRLLFELSRKFPETELIAYVFKLSKINTTFGFLKIKLPEVKREIDVFNALFSEFDYVTKQAIEEIYNTEFAFRTVCLNGTIGIAEIQPKGLKDFLPNSNRGAKAVKDKNDESFKHSLHIYSSWVIAMINDKNLIQQAAEFAGELLNISQKNIRGKTTETNLIKKLLESASRKSFIENLIPLLTENNADFMNRFVDSVDAISADKFPYLLTLIKFKYEYLSQLKTEEN